MTGKIETTRYWVEFECPFQLVDFDTDDLPHPDSPVFCSFCHSQHKGREHGQAFMGVGDQIEVLSIAEWEAASHVQQA